MLDARLFTKSVQLFGEEGNDTPPRSGLETATRWLTAMPGTDLKAVKKSGLAAIDITHRRGAIKTSTLYREWTCGFHLGASRLPSS